MLITRKSIISGNLNTRDLNITEEQMNRYMAGALIQDAFPHLSAIDREFIMTGMTEEEQNKLFGE